MTLRVRVYRPSSMRAGGGIGLPLVIHVHGGGFVGTAVQSDWVNSHLDAHIAENIRAGMTRDEARRDALLKLGGLA